MQVVYVETVLLTLSEFRKPEVTGMAHIAARQGVMRAEAGLAVRAPSYSPTVWASEAQASVFMASQE